MNAEKNNLDNAEGSPKKKILPFTEEGEIIDCNENLKNVGELNRKIYRITPLASPMQFTLKTDYRSYVTRPNGEKSGVCPMLVFSKYRIDDNRPMGPNGTDEKKPWSEFFFRLQEIFYKYPRNRLLKLENEFH